VRSRVILRDGGVLALFALLAVVMTWPLLPNLGRASADPEDPYLNTFILHWDYVATFTSPLSLFHAPIFHPAKYALAFSENMWGIFLLLFPLYAAGMPPLAVYNVALLAGFALSGWGAYLLCRSMTAATWPSVVGGFFFAFLPYRFTHLTHVQHVWAVWLPLLLLAAVAYCRRPSWLRAVAFGAVLLMNGLSNIHWLVFGTFAAACAVMLLMMAGKDRRQWSRIVIASAVALVLLLPFLIPYSQASRLYGMKRVASEVKEHSASPSDWLMTGNRPRFYRHFRGADRPNHELNLGWGLVPLLLTGAALAMTRREEFETETCTAQARTPSASRKLLRTMDVFTVVLFAVAWLAAGAGGFDLGFLRMKDGSIPSMAILLLLVVRFWISGAIPSALARSRFPLPVWCAFLWVALGVLGSLGLNTFFHQFLFDRIEIFRSIRVPARWSMIAYTGLAVTTAIGLQALAIRFRSSAARTALMAIAAAAMAVEFWTVPVRWLVIDPVAPPVYAWLRDAPVSGAVFEIPAGHGSDEYGYQFRAAGHGRPLVNGVSGFVPRPYAELLRKLSETPIDDRATEYLERIGTSTLIVHAHRGHDRHGALRQWLQLELRRGRLVFLRRFDHGLEGDYAFAVVKREPNIQALRASEQPDPSGRTPTQNLRAFLSGERTYINSPFGVLHDPRPGDVIEGSLTVSGWALAPGGVREVNLLFGNGRVRIPAKLDEWPALTRDVYPWYPRNPRPAFSATLPKPLPSLDDETDLQIEIVDSAGRRVLLDDVWFTWRAEDPDADKDRWRPRRRIIHPSSWQRSELDALLVSLGFDPNVERPAILEGRSSLDQLARRRAEEWQQVPDAEFIDRAYQALLHRKADAAGQRFYLERMKEGASRGDVLEGIIAADEFAQIHALE
jgi:hypothetical protein